MPGGVAQGSVQRLRICFPDPQCQGDQDIDLRWPGILAVSEADVEGAIPVVAGEFDGVDQGFGGAPVIGVVFGGRRFGGEGRGALAAGRFRGVREKT